MYFDDYEGHVIQLDGIRAVLKHEPGVKDGTVYGISIYYFNDAPSYDHRVTNIWLDYKTYQTRDRVWNDLVGTLTREEQ